MIQHMTQECRLIDHVSILGGKQPFKLFTMDLDDLALEVDRSAVKEPSGRAAKYKAKYDRQRKRNERWSDDFDMHQYYLNDRDILIMRHKFSQEFSCRFNMAYLNYEAGNWSIAKSMLEATRFLLATEDGPSAVPLPSRPSIQKAMLANRQSTKIYDRHQLPILSQSTDILS